MRQKIAETFPDHGIFGEEEGMQQPRDTDAQYLWVLDPIDGTKSFITGVSTQLLSTLQPVGNNQGHAHLASHCNRRLSDRLSVMPCRQTCIWYSDSPFAQWCSNPGGDRPTHHARKVDWRQRPRHNSQQ